MSSVFDFIITEEARLKMFYAINHHPNREVSWFGKGHVDEDGDVVLTDIHIPPQEVGGAHIEIKPDALADFWTELTRRGERIKDWFIWCHSHAGMSTSPSGTDVNTLEMLAKQFGDMSVGLVANNRGDYTCWAVQMRPWKLTVKDVKVLCIPNEDLEIKAEIEAAMEHVKEPPPRTYERKDGAQYPFGKGTQSGKTSHEQRGGAGTAASASESRGLANNPVVNMRPSTLYNGCIEIMRKDGTFIVVKDMGQMDAWAAMHKDGLPRGRKARRLNKMMNEAAGKHRKAGTRNYSGATHMQHIGYDADGMPLVQGEEADLCFGIDGKPFIEDGSPPLNERLLLTGPQDKPMYNPADGLQVLSDGTMIDDGHLITMVDLRAKYLIPPEIENEDVIDFVNMIHEGNNPFSPAGVGSKAED